MRDDNSNSEIREITVDLHCVLKVFLKKIIIFLYFKIFFLFLDCFDVLVLKINLKNKKLFRYISKRKFFEKQ